jgi:hypothetical protein
MEIPKIPKLPDLSKIDIKDIDINKIKAELLEHKEVVVQVALGVVSFFMVLSLIGGCQGDIKKYKNQIRSMESKSGIIGQYKKSQTDIDAFLKSIPAPMTEGKIIAMVTDLADKNKVKILTFAPLNRLENTTKKSYQETVIQFSLQASTYQSMVRLIADIEYSKKDVLQVRSCVIQKAAADKQKNEEPPLNFRIEVASLEVKK